MIQAAQNFITLFSPCDYIGLVTFDITAHLVYAPSTSYGNGTLNTDIGNIVCQSNTNTISALQLAYQEIQAVNPPLALNTIMLFTGSSPNGVSAAFPLPYTAGFAMGSGSFEPGGARAERLHVRARQ